MYVASMLVFFKAPQLNMLAMAGAAVVLLSTILVMKDDTSY